MHSKDSAMLYDAIERYRPVELIYVTAYGNIGSKLHPKGNDALLGGPYPPYPLTSALEMGQKDNLSASIRIN